jgi:hypothetical protein
MNMNDLDRILLSEEAIEPSKSFSESVMSRIQAEAITAIKVPFPWIRFAVVMIIAAALIVPIFPSETIARALNMTFLNLGEWIVSPADIALRNAFLLAMTSLCGTVLLVWISFKLAGAER